jgi:hypothetical protein
MAFVILSPIGFVIPSRIAFVLCHSEPHRLCHSEPQARNLRCIDAPRSLARAARGLGMTMKVLRPDSG